MNTIKNALDSNILNFIIDGATSVMGTGIYKDAKGITFDEFYSGCIGLFWVDHFNEKLVNDDEIESMWISHIVHRDLEPEVSKYLVYAYNRLLELKELGFPVIEREYKASNCSTPLVNAIEAGMIKSFSDFTA